MSDWIALLATEPAGAEPVSDFAFRHAWSLPFLDAAAPFVRGAEDLRARVLLMAAVLEASPEYAADFLPRDASRARIIVALAGHAIAAGARMIVGVPLLLFVRRAP